MVFPRSLISVQDGLIEQNVVSVTSSTVDELESSPYLNTYMHLIERNMLLTCQIDSCPDNFFNYSLNNAIDNINPVYESKDLSLGCIRL